MRQFVQRDSVILRGLRVDDLILNLNSLSCLNPLLCSSLILNCDSPQYRFNPDLECTYLCIQNTLNAKVYLNARPDSKYPLLGQGDTSHHKLCPILLKIIFSLSSLLFPSLHPVTHLLTREEIHPSTNTLGRKPCVISSVPSPVHCRDTPVASLLSFLQNSSRNTKYEDCSHQSQ